METSAYWFIFFNIYWRLVIELDFLIRAWFFFILQIVTIVTIWVSCIYWLFSFLPCSLWFIYWSSWSSLSLSSLSRAWSSFNIDCWLIFLIWRFACVYRFKFYVFLIAWIIFMLIIVSIIAVCIVPLQLRFLLLSLSLSFVFPFNFLVHLHGFLRLSCPLVWTVVFLSTLIFLFLVITLTASSVLDYSEAGLPVFHFHKDHKTCSTLLNEFLCCFVCNLISYVLAVNHSDRGVL